MSIREDIATDIVSTLNSFTYSGNGITKVVRAPLAVGDLARTSFPVAVVTTADERRSDATIGGPAIIRDGVITYFIDLHVWGINQDQMLNTYIDVVERALDADRKRNGLAVDTQVTGIRLLNAISAKPWTDCRISVRVEYCYQRGNT